MAERVVQTCTVAGAVRLRSTPCIVTCNIFVLYCSWQTQTPLGELTALPQTTLAGFKGAYFSANLFTVDSRRVVPAR